MVQVLDEICILHTDVSTIIREIIRRWLAIASGNNFYCDFIGFIEIKRNGGFFVNILSKLWKIGDFHVKSTSKVYDKLRCSFKFIKIEEKELYIFENSVEICTFLPQTHTPSTNLITSQTRTNWS